MKPKNISILYIEDNQKQRKLFCSMATKVCSKLHIADNTKDALKLYKSKKIDIVVVSLDMQKRASIDICTAIKEKNPNQLFICLVLEKDKDLLFKAISLEIDYYIALPFDMKIVKNILKKAIKQIEYRESFVKLQESEEKFRQMSQTSQMGVFIYKEKYVYVNDAFCKMTGYSKRELYGMNVWNLMEEDKKVPIKDICLRRINGEHFPKVHHDLEIVTKSGEIKINRITTDTMKYNGEFAGFGTSVDITDIKATKEKLQLLAQAMEQMDEMVRITDIDGKIIYVNEALCKHTLYQKDELIGKQNNIFKSNQHPKEFYTKMWKTILSNKSYQGVFINLKKNGELYYEDQIITPMLDENDQIKHFVSTSKDVSLRIATENKLKLLATTDALTGIYNRYKINMKIEEELSRVSRYAETFALIMFDIDFFKKVNDKHGHERGDYVLVELSQIVSSSIRESDKFGRWGGEEFMILAPNITKEDAIRLAEKLRMRVESYNFENVGSVTISLGVVTSSNKNDKELMLKGVDNALYEAKNSGRNRVVYSA